MDSRHATAPDQLGSMDTEQLRRRFPHLLELRLEPDRAGSAGPVSYTEKIAGRPDLDVCCGFLEHVRGRTATPDETRLLQQALEAALIESMEGVVAGPAYHDLSSMAGALTADRRLSGT